MNFIFPTGGTLTPEHAQRSSWRGPSLGGLVLIALLSSTVPWAARGQTCVDAGLYGKGASGTYSLVPIEDGRKPTAAYFDSLGIADLDLGTKCQKNCKKDCRCWSVITNGAGATVRSFSTSDSVKLLAKGRYRGFTALLLARSTPCRRHRVCTDYFTYDARRGRRRFESPYVDDVLASILTSRGAQVVLTPTQIRQHDQNGGMRVLYRLPEHIELTQGIFRNNPDGDVSVLAIDSTDQVHLGTPRSLQETGVFLAAHGDRQGVLASYPDSRSTAYGVVYRYINEYNKGLHFIVFDGHTGRVTNGPLFNSEKINLGWDPDIYARDGEVLVSAHNASADCDVRLQLGRYALASVKPVHLEHTTGYETEKLASLLYGVGGMMQSWFMATSVSQEVRDDDSIDSLVLAETNYAIPETLLWSHRFEGRIWNAHLVLNYVQNIAAGVLGDEVEAHHGEGAGSVASFLFGAVSFDGLVGKSATLSLQTEITNMKGRATFQDHLFESTRQVDFETKTQEYTLLYITDRGFYGGFEYAQNQIPSAVGFSDRDKDVVYVDFDDELQLSRGGLFFGYDKISYARRYETQYQDFYITGRGGFGLGVLTISDDVVDAALAMAQKTEFSDKMVLALSGTVEAGVIVQGRLKFMGGLGLSLVIAYRADGRLYYAGQSKYEYDESGKNVRLDLDHQIEPEALALEYFRTDLSHGPWIRLNLIY